MTGAAGRVTYSILLRIFFSYTRRITGGSKPGTTAELAKSGKFSAKQKGSRLRLPHAMFLKNQAFFAALILAQRAFCAAATLARPAALIPRFFFADLAAGAGAPRMAASSFSKLAISSLMAAARFSCADVNVKSMFIGGRL
jgi:hypothetical protein